MSYRWIAHATIAAAVGLGLSTTAAQADTYAPTTNSQDFVTDNGGWVGSAVGDGLCIPVLTCPSITNDYVATGGADGNGYLRTSVAAVLNTTAATVNIGYESPAFTYQGNGGQVPATVTFNMNIRPALGGLLGLDVANQSTFRVDLVEQGSGNQISVVPATQLVNSAAWTAVPTVSVNPSQLQVGASYTIRITTAYRSLASVLGTGEIGYDNVRLTTAGTAGNGGGGSDGNGGTGGTDGTNGTNGGNGTGSGGTNGTDGGNGGSGVLTESQLRTMAVSTILPGSARLANGTVKIKLKCPAKAAPRQCAVNVKGLKGGKKSSAATKAARAKLKAGKNRTITLKVKPGSLAKYLKAKTVYVKSKVNVGSVAVTVRKRVKLKH